MPCEMAGGWELAAGWMRERACLAKIKKKGLGRNENNVQAAGLGQPTEIVVVVVRKCNCHYGECNCLFVIGAHIIMLLRRVFFLHRVFLSIIRRQDDNTTARRYLLARSPWQYVPATHDDDDDGTTVVIMIMMSIADDDCDVDDDDD